MIQNRFIGLKSRGCYDSPAMTILRLAHLDAESLVMDGKVRSLRDQFVTHNWSELLYNGLYFSPEREFIENSLVFSQKRVVRSTLPSPPQTPHIPYLAFVRSSMTTFLLLPNSAGANASLKLTIPQNAEVRLRCYKGNVSIRGRSSETEKLYSSEEASMDSLENFSPADTSMFFPPFPSFAPFRISFCIMSHDVPFPFSSTQSPLPSVSHLSVLPWG